MMKTTLLSILLLERSTAFQSCASLPRQLHPHPFQQATAAADDDGGATKEKGDNKAMAFLRNKGKIGGAANMDFASVSRLLYYCSCHRFAKILTILFAPGNGLGRISIWGESKKHPRWDKEIVGSICVLHHIWCYRRHE